MHPPSVGLQSVRTKTTLFVSGAPEVAKRYRCDHQAEQLELLGATVDVATHGELDLAVVAATTVSSYSIAWPGGETSRSFWSGFALLEESLSSTRTTWSSIRT